MHFAIVIQARTGSTRLPKKSIKVISGYTLLEILIYRLKDYGSRLPIIIATTTKQRDDIIERISLKNDVLVFRGSEDDVLDRYYQTAKQYGLEIISRVTADNPFTLPNMIIQQKNFLLKNNLDYVSSQDIIPGLGNEVFTFDALSTSWLNAKQKYEREHVTPYIYEHKTSFRLGYMNPPSKYKQSNIRLTIDTKQDLILFRRIQKELGSLKEIDIDSVLYLMRSNNTIRNINSEIVQKDYKE